MDLHAIEPGKTYGRYTAIELLEGWDDNEPFGDKWLVRCACGMKITEWSGCMLRSTVSHCGGHMRNGLSTKRAYQSWSAMKARCRNPDAMGYSAYGGRGITICEAWCDYQNFFADMGERPEGMSIDRIDVNGNYSCGKCEECIEKGWPANCRWATKTRQARNTRRGGNRNPRYTGVNVTENGYDGMYACPIGRDVGPGNPAPWLITMMRIEHPLLVFISGDDSQWFRVDHCYIGTKDELEGVAGH